MFLFDKGDRQGGLVAEVVQSKGTSRHMIIHLESVHAWYLYERNQKGKQIGKSGVGLT